MIRTHYFEPNVDFDFDVSVSNCMLSTNTSKLNLTLGTFSGICPGGFEPSLVCGSEKETHFKWEKNFLKIVLELRPKQSNLSLNIILLELGVIFFFLKIEGQEKAITKVLA